jgi:hypothetical protein
MFCGNYFGFGSDSANVADLGIMCAADATATATAVLSKRIAEVWVQGHNRHVGPVAGSTQILELFTLDCLLSKVCTLLEKAGFAFTEIIFPRRSFSSAEQLRSPKLQCSYSR